MAIYHMMNDFSSTVLVVRGSRVSYAGPSTGADVVHILNAHDPIIPELDNEKPMILERRTHKPQDLIYARSEAIYPQPIYNEGG